MTNNEQEPTSPKDQESFTPQPVESPPAPAQQLKEPRRWGKTLVQLLPGLFVLLIAIILVVVGLALSSSLAVVTTNKLDYSTELSSARSTYDENNSSSDSAPQQSVANGWYTNDLLVILTNTVGESASGYSAVTTNQQKIMFLIWISVALLLAALGGYLILSKLLQRD